ncbi:cadherin-5 isoform X2 [Oncorhynchus tshawytscha]|uniref:cadherin-5 isoform X2 n=1 Tax=Oncorhynchus tshawytscha TaxID=74940 RepID=UPI000D0A7979|nr:cadherin-5 isoform X2 [Oncorhynchus tshawytscha]
MMRKSAWRQMTGPEMWMGLFALAVTLSLTMAEHVDQRPALQTSPVLHRHKREWLWNNLYVEEERPTNKQYYIGKLKSTKSGDGTHYVIKGEGANTIFKVDEKGHIYVTERLDREEKSKYLLSAKLFDTSNILVEKVEEFVILVTDINDNDPVFTKSFSASIKERSKSGTKVIEVTATDADDPTTANGELAYTLLEGGDFFNIDNTTGIITTKYENLDRETQSSYVVVVQAQDLRGLKQGGTATTSVTIAVSDINDNIATFTKRSYVFSVKEDMKRGQRIDTIVLEDRDEIQNKDPIVTIEPPSDTFEMERSQNKDGNLMLKQGLDYETKSSYTFFVHVRENHLQSPVDNKDNPVIKAQVTIQVLDVDEQPEFSESLYNFNVIEEIMVNNIGVVSARDPDKANKAIRYSIEDKDSPIGINPITGQLFTVRKLDRELVANHMFQVKAKEEPNGLESFVNVNILVIDINDNKPELSIEEIFVCENDMAGTVIGTISATDKDDHLPAFSFTLVKPNGNFSVVDNNDNTSNIVLKHGGFSLEDSRDYVIEIGISDGGRPPMSSITTLPIKVCRCDNKRIHTQCKAAQLKMGVGVYTLIPILCILTILIIVILIAMRKRHQKDALVTLGKSEIHEQLVTYDEEGGGEMDTNGYDVSILTSARNDGSMSMRQGPSLYAMVKKPPTACKGDMAVMIEVKKDEADHDRDGIPYDTLHIYGYEGPESLAGSLSSLDSSSTGSSLDYDFLNDWGPRFKTLAELYGVDGSEGSDSLY